MKAAIITRTGSAPVYGDTAEPEAKEGEIVINVTAAPISPVVRLRASAPVSPEGTGLAIGVDGVGTNTFGERVYFLFPKQPFGSLAERTLVPASMTVPVPDGLSDTAAAAMATAGLASWVALTRRVPIEPGQTVLVTGANGAAGHLALQIARHHGAGRTIAVVRTATGLEGLPADQGIALDAADADDVLKDAFREGVDIVLDFAWGGVAERIFAAATTGRGAPTGEPRLRYAVIGTIAGQTVPLAGYGLQSSGIEIVGSGIGSVPGRDYLAACAELLNAAQAAGFSVPHEVRPLSEIGDIWDLAATHRYVIRP